MDYVIVLVIVIVGISYFAFQNKNVINKLIMSPYLVIHKNEWYRVITHAFIHANWMHLLFNMIALWSFGSAVVQYFDYVIVSNIPNVHFFMLFFVGVIIASTPDIVKHKNDIGYLSLGASGGVSAVVFSAIFFNPWSTVLVFFIPCPGIIFGVLYLWYSNYMSKKGGDNINHSAHFYGAVFGFLYPILIQPSIVFHFIQQLMHPSFLQ